MVTRITVNTLQDVKTLLDALTMRMQLISLAGQILAQEGFGIEARERVENREGQKECAELVLAVTDEWRRLSKDLEPGLQREMNDDLGGSMDQIENAMIEILRTLREQTLFTQVVGIDASYLD
jgi:hypothetical protein